MASPDAVTLRPATATDTPRLATLSRDLIETGLRWRYTAPALVRLLRDPEHAGVVARDAGGGLLGFALMQFGDERAHLVLLCVQADGQRRGTGTRLLEWLTESARVAGIASLHLELRADNPGALAFYRAQGYTETAMLPGYYDGCIDARRMRRVLRQGAPA